MNQSFETPQGLGLAVRRVGFRKSATGLARGALVNVSGVRGPVLVGEVLVDELDGSGVVSGVAAEARGEARG
jgi:hypothetical protein